MDVQQLRATWASPRARRRLTLATLLTVGVAAFAAQQAPYATIAPGPTPDLSAAVLDAQDRGSRVDPTLGAGGAMLATTVNATQLSWAAAAWCSVKADCAMLPVDVSDPSVRNRAAVAMTASQQSARSVARTWAGSDPAYPNAHLAAELGEVGGSSAGLMLTLAFIDALTAGDLTGGRVVAGTGTVTASGSVGAVAGAAQKVRGAAARGATVFFAPAAEYADAHAAAAAYALEVVAVDDVEDAVRWLCGHGGRSTACSGPARP